MFEDINKKLNDIRAKMNDEVGFFINYKSNMHQRNKKKIIKLSITQEYH